MKERNMKERKDDKRENLCYIEADKPLVYNFFDAKTLQELIDKEPTSGKRKENKKKKIMKIKMKMQMNWRKKRMKKKNN